MSNHVISWKELFEVVLGVVLVITVMALWLLGMLWLGSKVLP